MRDHAQVVGAFGTARRDQRADVVVDVFHVCVGSINAHAGKAGSHLIDTDDHGHLRETIRHERFNTGSLNAHLAFVEFDRGCAIGFIFNTSTGHTLILQVAVVHGQTVDVATVGSGINRCTVARLKALPAVGTDLDLFAGSRNGPQFVDGQSLAVKGMRRSDSVAGKKRQGSESGGRSRQAKLERLGHDVFSLGLIIGTSSTSRCDRYCRDLCLPCVRRGKPCTRAYRRSERTGAASCRKDCQAF